jgi:hypothetical protein
MNLYHNSPARTHVHSMRPIAPPHLRRHCRHGERSPDLRCRMSPCEAQTSHLPLSSFPKAPLQCRRRARFGHRYRTEATDCCLLDSALCARRRRGHLARMLIRWVPVTRPAFPHEARNRSAGIVFDGIRFSNFVQSTVVPLICGPHFSMAHMSVA